MTKKTKTEMEIKGIALVLSLVLIILMNSFAVIGAPDGPTSINNTENRTKNATSAAVINTSGGYISTINVTAVVQNTKWKAFVGWIDGRFTLDDAAGSTIYDWNLTTITGEVYATRQSGTITWASIACANNTTMEAENNALSHSNIADNITSTFRRDSTHNAFAVGSTTISANSCPTLNTYVSDAAQNTYFQEVALYDSANIVYSTILEADATGYNAAAYDFQMIVPENASISFTSRTAYYLYVELS